MLRIVRSQRGVRQAQIVRLLSLMLSLMPIAAAAEQWMLQPAISAYAQYTDNQHLSINDPQESLSTMLDMRVDVVISTETSSSRFVPRLRTTAYASDGDSHQTNDGFAHYDGVYSLGRGSLLMQVDLSSESTLTSELQETGVILADKYRHTFSLSPAFEYEASERAQYQLGGFVQRVDYRHAETTPLVGYDYSGLNGTYTYKLDELTSLTGSATWARLDVPTTNSVTDSGIVGVSLLRQQNERLRIAGSFTYRYSDMNTAAKGSDAGVGGNLRLDYAGEKDHWYASVSMDLRPYGSGVMVEERRSAFSYQHQWSPARNMVFEFGWLNSEDIEDNAAVRGRDYMWIEGRLDIPFNSQWHVHGGYRFASQKYAGDPAAADANLVFVNVRYQMTSRLYSN